MAQTRAGKIIVVAALAALLFASPTRAEVYRLDPGAELPEQTVDRDFNSLSAPVRVTEELDARTLDPACVGKIGRFPNYVIDVTEPVPLIITAPVDEIDPAQGEDFTLVVRAPDGSFICDDDSGGDRRPQIVLTQPQLGRYEIWLGVYGQFTLGNEPRIVAGALSIAPARTAGPRPRPDPGPAAVETPPFPRWPPPRASARAELPRTLFAGDARLGDVADRLVSALRSAGNTRSSFYTAPGGFVLVARLERIRDDARPAADADRFVNPRPGDVEKPDDPLGFIEALFFAPEGRYRQVMFVATDRPVGEGAWTLTSDGAGELLDEGSAGLANAARNAAFGAGHRVVALIYEFRKQGGGQAEVIIPGRWDGDTHLARSGVLTNLRR